MQCTEFKERGRASRPPLSTATILFVDDEAPLLEALKRCLHRAPFAVMTALSAEAALTILEQSSVDVVVSDERMPGTSGSVFLNVVRERFPSVVRILLTGGVSLDEAARAIDRSGIYRFLNKPVTPDVLVRTLENALAMKRLLATSSKLREQLEPHRARLPLPDHSGTDG